MPVTKQLYELQELDTEIEQAEQSLSQKNGMLGKRYILEEALNRLDTSKKHLEDLKHQRREAEADVDDTLSKIKDAEKQLYGGKITNPKELSNLQHEINTLKTHNDQLETKALEIIDQVEESEKIVSAIDVDYHNLEKEWQIQQKQLAVEIEQLKIKLTDLNERRRQLAEIIEPEAVQLYEKVRQQKKPAVSKVEQGICRYCRISLSASSLQKARAGQPILCGTCGRILFIS
jgi:predicted  nucleic acid-binding Zn-ribbon protein